MSEGGLISEVNIVRFRLATSIVALFKEMTSVTTASGQRHALSTRASAFTTTSGAGPRKTLSASSNRHGASPAPRLSNWLPTESMSLSPTSRLAPGGCVGAVSNRRSPRQPTETGCSSSRCRKRGQLATAFAVAAGEATL